MARRSGRTDRERFDAQLMSPDKTRRVPGPSSPVSLHPLHHQPHQTPGKPFLQRPAIETSAPPASSASSLCRYGPEGTPRPKSTCRSGWRSPLATRPAGRGPITFERRRHTPPCRGHPRGHPVRRRPIWFARQRCSGRIMRTSSRGAGRDGDSGTERGGRHPSAISARPAFVTRIAAAQAAAQRGMVPS